MATISAMGPAQALGVAMLIFVLIEVPFVALFIRRRHHYPIRGRHPNAAIVIGVLAIVWQAFFCFRFIGFDLIPCVIHVVFMRLPVEVFAHIYLYRVWLLYIEHHRLFGKQRLLHEQKHAVVRSDSGTSIDLKANEAVLTTTSTFGHWVAHRTPAQVRRLLCITCLAVCVTLVPPMMYLARPPTNFWSTRDCVYGVNSLFMLAEVATHAAIFAFFSFKFSRLADDNFGLKAEFRVIGIVMLINIVATFIIYGVPALLVINNSILPIQLLPLSVGAFVCFIATIIHPVVLSYRVSPLMNSMPLGRSSSFVLEQTSEFSHMLQTPASFRAFYLFLSREFAIENLLFWQQAQKLRETAEEQQMPSSQLAQLALDMYDLYFASQAPLEVNVTHPVRVAIKSTIEGIRANVGSTTYTTLTKVYDAAEKEVFRLMMHDPYPRFRKSPEFETVASIVATSRAQSMMFDDV